MRKTVWITTSFIGFHQWIEAPDEVDYLASLHRHKFGVRAEVEPRDDSDRAIEFHLLQERVNTFIRQDLLPLNPTDSCERIAMYIADHLYNNNFVESVRVSVDEDGECGATVTLGEGEQR